MGVEAVSRAQAAELAVSSLGLDPAIVELSSKESLSALLRRVASYYCPTTRQELIDTALDSLQGLVEGEFLRDQLGGVLDEVINVGDILELAEADADDRLIYLSRPSFVRRGGSRALLLGIRPEGGPILDDEIVSDIEPEGHLRFIQLGDRLESFDHLEHLGLQELSRNVWLRSPRGVDADEYIAHFDARLSAVDTQPLELAGSLILDPAAKVTYYRGRWRSPASDDTGRFVGRRPQAYGSDLWMYAEVQEGRFTRAIDLPIRQESSRGADEAWRLQAAMDHRAGHPQVLEVIDSERHRLLLCLFAPIPSWAQRRLDLVAIPVPRRRGALLCYSIDRADVAHEVKALAELMWTKEID